MKRYVSVAACAVIATCWFPRAGFSEPKPEPQKAITIAKIVNVELTVQTAEPPNLIVKAIGEVPTGGYDPKLVKLERVEYVKAPDDGIQDYTLTAVKPGGFVTQVISKVEGVDTWKDFRKSAPWLKGVRIHGAGDGVVVKELPK
ncbi:MAG: hypothetical protein QM811_12990 [Pirellulales bacterium]